MDINSIYVLLKSHQNDDNTVTCSWDFSDAGYIDSEENERVLDKQKLALEALYVPDPENPLITQLPQELQFEKKDKISKLYKAKGRFTLGEILEIVRSFVEKVYNEKYSNNRYTFKELYFEGITETERSFEISLVSAGGNMMGAFGGLQQFVDMMEM